MKWIYWKKIADGRNAMKGKSVFKEMVDISKETEISSVH